MADDLITGLDLGSSSIRVVVGQNLPSEEGAPQLHIMGAISVPADGIHKGSISSIEDAVSSISKALERAERMTGVALNSAWVSIAGQQILVQESRGVIGVAKPDGEIQEDDIERAIEAARTVATPSNYEILHVIPKSFTVDGQQGIKDPVGMNGIRLEVDAVIIQTLTSQIKNVTKSIYRTGLDIDDLVFSPLAASEAVLSNRQKELGVCLVDIGASTSSMVVYEEGDILHTAVLPFGGDHFTNDIAIGLRTSLEIAEEIKKQLGHCVPGHVTSKEDYLLSDFGSQEQDAFKQRFIAQICEARAEELFEAVDAELKKIDRSGMLPVGIVLTGGGMKLPGMVEISKRVLRLPSVMGEVQGVSGVIDEVKDLSFVTAIGLTKWGYAIASSKKSRFNLNIKGVGDIKQKLQKLIKTIIP